MSVEMESSFPQSTQCSYNYKKLKDKYNKKNHCFNAQFEVIMKQSPLLRLTINTGY